MEEIFWTLYWPVLFIAFVWAMRWHTKVTKRDQDEAAKAAQSINGRFVEIS